METTEFRQASDGAEIVLHRRDCLSGMRELLEPESIDVVVTSPPYNLGVAYRSYDDTVSRAEYLDWIEAWGEALRRVLGRGGSLFLNVGGKPSDPWGPFDILQRLRKLFALQNTFHWIKSIAIDADHAAGHYKPINSKRYVNDCHEYIFHLTRFGDVELDRLAVGVEYQDKSNIGRWSAAKGRSAMPGQYLVHSLPDDSEPREGTASPGDVSDQVARDVHPAPRTATGRLAPWIRSWGWDTRRWHARRWECLSWVSSWMRGTSRRRATCWRPSIPRPRMTARRDQLSLF